jgi:hypothetical protein
MAPGTARRHGSVAAMWQSAGSMCYIQTRPCPLHRTDEKKDIMKGLSLCSRTL